MLPFFNPVALRKAKIVYNFGFSECNRVKKADKHGSVPVHRKVYTTMQSDLTH